MQRSFVNQWIRQFRRRANTDEKGRALIRARSIYILPTKQGIVLAFLLILMLIGSVNYGSNLGYLLTFLLGGIWLTSILHTWRNLLGLTLLPRQAPPVFTGQTACFELLLENPSVLNRYGISIASKDAMGDACDLNARESCVLTIQHKTTHRGELVLGEVRIQSCYPLGLFKAWTYAHPDMHCLVYPAPAKEGEPPTEAVYNRSEVGDLGVGADDFVGLRVFRQGDSPRHIDWKALARERGLFSKQFGGDRSEQLCLDWELLNSPDPEVRISQLCRYVLLAHQRQLAYGLKLPGIDIPIAHNENHKARCLKCLAKYGLDT